MKNRWFVVCAFIVCLAPVLSAQEAQKKSEKEIAQRDYQYQGEYVGELGADGQTQRMGMQVIAIGNGQFKVKAFNEGLPGDGWNGEAHEEIKAIGKLNDQGVVEFRGYHRGNADIMKDGTMKISLPDGSPYGELKKTVRKSETLGAKPPANAEVLFDGSSVEGWKKGRLSDEGHLMQGTTSKKTFGSHHLHIEFLLPFQPTKSGQARGNSGIYVQGRYEVQMLDSFGLEPAHNLCGGIYSVKPPKMNMCFPPMTWQTYDIDFTEAKYDEAGKQTKAATMTVKHNGVLIHEDVELPPRKTTAAPVNPGPEPGPVYLQDHGNPVRYRNIWVLAK